MGRTRIFIGVGALFILGATILWLLFPRTVTSPIPLVSEQTLPRTEQATSSETVATPAKSVAIIQMHPLPIATSDTIASWNFSGAYANHPELILKAQNDIKRFSDMLLTATSSTQSLLVSIANEYDLLGMGKEEYGYLGRAIRAGETTGLPWYNLGVLMERLGAFKTARIAYEKAAELQPFDQYLTALDEFRAAHPAL